MNLPSARRRNIIDEWLFVLVVFVGLVIAMQGKAMAGHLFGASPDWIREESPFTHMLCAAIAGGLAIIRNSPMSLRIRTLSATVISFVGVTTIHIFSSGPSVLVYCLQLLLLIFAATVVAIERDILYRDFEPAFWKLILDVAFRVIRYVIMLYVAGFALLKFLSDGIKEDKLGFLTSFAYPTVIVVYSLFIVIYWLALPAWENLVRSHERQRLLATDVWENPDVIARNVSRIVRPDA
jgi:hypothetical protein